MIRSLKSLTYFLTFACVPIAEIKKSGAKIQAITFITQPGMQIRDRLYTTAVIALYDKSGVPAQIDQTNPPRITLSLSKGKGKVYVQDPIIEGNTITFQEIRFSIGGTKKIKANIDGFNLSIESQSFELDPLAGVASDFEFFDYDSIQARGAENSFSIKAVDVYGSIAEDFVGSVSIESAEAIPGLPLIIEFTEQDMGSKSQILSYTKELIGKYKLQAQAAERPTLVSESPTIYVYKRQEFYLGTQSACVIYENKLKCWGRGHIGQLASGSTDNIGDQLAHVGNIPFADIGATPVAISFGNHHACVLTDELKVKCFGNNGSGQIGVGDTESYGDEIFELGNNLQYVDLDTDKKVIQLEAGCNQNCVIFDDMSLKCWGLNTAGTLGQGDLDNRGHTPQTVPRLNLAIDLGSGRHPIDISGGCGYFCAILDNQSVKCWGQSASGRLGIEAPGHRGDDPNEMGDNLPVVNLGTNFTPKQIIASGSGSSCAVSTQGSVKCWGNNTFGQLGQGDQVHRGANPGSMGDNLSPINLGTGRIALEVQSGTGGSGCVCSLLDDNTGKCWGRNDFGQIGIGTSSNMGDDPNEMGDNLPVVMIGTQLPIKSLQCNADRACAYFGNALVKCWGSGEYGALANGSVDPVGTDPNHLGLNLPFINLD